MKTATVRDLRNNFARLEAWLAEGEKIQINKRGKTVGVLAPPTPDAASEKIQMPDFQARLKRIWGDRVFSNEEVAAMRAAELEGEEG